MTEIRFYHLQKQRLEDALPGLLEKARERGHRIVVQAGSAERVKMLGGRLKMERQPGQGMRLEVTIPFIEK